MTPTAEDAVAALAARLYRAVAEDWDHQQCNTEARAFIAALREHGWIWEPAAISFDNRRRGPRAHPDVIAQSMATIRAAIQDGQAKSAIEQEEGSE